MVGEILHEMTIFAHYSVLLCGDEHYSFTVSLLLPE